MTLRDQIAADASLFLATDDFAESITYRLPDGTESSLTAIVFDALTENRDERGINTIVTTRNVTCALADVGAVNLRGQIVYGGEDWAITRVIYQDDLFLTLEIQRHELHESTRPGYRRT